MNAKTLYALIAAAAVALLAAWWINASHAPVSESVEQSKPLLPGLRERVNDITAITITGAGNQVLATLKRGSEGWNVEQKSGYPADVAKLREFLLKLADATVLETKTSNPKLYGELGVDDVKDKDAKGVLVTLEGLKQPVKLIVGNYNGGGGGGTFVRREGEAQTLLAKGNLSVEKTVAGWEKHELTDIPASRLQQVTITNPDGKTLKVSKEHPGDANFKVADVPKGREPSSDFVADALGSTLSGLRADDVFTAKEMPPPDKVYKANYAAFDGLNVAVVAWVKDGKDYAQLSASLDDTAAAVHISADQTKAQAEYEAAVQAANKKLAEEKPATGPAAKAAAKAASDVAKPLAVSDAAKDRDERLKALNDEVAVLNKTFAGWTFVLPSFKFANIDKSMDDMLKPLESKKPEAKGTKPGAAKPAPKPAPAKGKP
ncbi:MAG TPA: DUF4340 domain-containing protein [Rudaea sp.]|nr:DUF4340 domain-containing protein [Rudaea sp.]